MNITLKQLRTASGHSQTELAALLELNTVQLVSNWERAKSKPSLPHLLGLSAIYGMPVEELIHAIEFTHKQSLALKNGSGS